MPFAKVPRWAVPAVQILLLGGIFAGFGVLLRYENTPGRPDVACAATINGGLLPLDRHVPTLVMAAHPMCPCTEASLAELASLMAEDGSKVLCYIVFVHLPGEPDPKGEGSYWKMASAIPGAHCILDEGGVLARSLGARTSGQVLVIAPTGQVRFAGGITGSRGHAGDNDGADSVRAILEHRHPARSRTPVFGCSIFGAPVELNPDASPGRGT